jgi:biotin transport system substrate-specific component
MEAILQKEIIVGKLACRVIGVAVFIVLTALGAFVRVPLPFTPVPLTLQTFFVLLSGAFLGSGLGAATQLGYILLGAAGLPIFTNAGSGALYFCGPTAGYLLGFVLAAFCVGQLIGRAKSFLAVSVVFLLSDLLLLTSGALWLKIISGFSLSKVFLIGVLPFLPLDLAKALAASGIYLRLRKRLGEIFH